MKTATNELDNLLMSSLRQLSAEFQEREVRLSAEYENSAKLFTRQSSALNNQYDEVSKRLDELTQHYVNTQALMQRIVTQLNALSGRSR